MKNNKNLIATGLLFLLIDVGFVFASQILSIQNLALISFVFMILGINKLIKGSLRKTDFKLARWSILISVVAIIFSVFYTIQVVQPLIFDHSIEEIVDLIMNDTSVVLMLLISANLVSAVTFFIMQGLEELAKIELDNPKLAKMYKGIKYLVVVGVGLSLLTYVSSMFEPVVFTFGLLFPFIQVYLFWTTRKLVLETDEIQFEEHKKD